MTTKLVCPLCGREVMVEYIDNYDFYTIECPHCKLSISGSYAKPIVKKWNNLEKKN